MSKKDIRISILKKLQSHIEPKCTDYELSQKDFAEMLDEMQEDGFIRNAVFVRAGGRNDNGKAVLAFIDRVSVTISGEEYLEKNDI